MITLSDVKCRVCKHSADIHAARDGCADPECRCGYDPRQILLDEINQRQAVLDAAREALTELRTIAAAIADAECQGAEVPETVYVKNAVVVGLADALDAAKRQG